MKTMGELFPSRRDLLEWGGRGILAAAATAAWPLRMGATGEKVKPRGTARNVLFYEISGAISHIESFDFKESAGMPKDLEVKKVDDGLYLSQLLFTKVSKQIDKVAILKSVRSHEEVHFRRQYYQ